MMVPVYACLEKIQAELRDVWSHLESNRFTNSLQKAGSFQLVAAPTHIQGGKYQILEFLPTSLLSVDISSLQSGALDHVYVRRMSWLLWSAELVSSHFSSQLCIFMWKFVQRQVCRPKLQDAMSLQWTTVTEQDSGVPVMLGPLYARLGRTKLKKKMG